jgi:hypothetical protein
VGSTGGPFLGKQVKVVVQKTILRAASSMVHGAIVNDLLRACRGSSVRRGNWLRTRAIGHRRTCASRSGIERNMARECESAHALC